MSIYHQPFGCDDLCPDVQIDVGPPKRIRCFVGGCKHILRCPTNKDDGEACPDHKIRCHSSGTYSYADVRGNLIVDAELFATRVVGHPFKYETDRIGNENSEDALTWNVFRSFQHEKCLHRVAELIIGQAIKDEPQLYLWGLRLSDNSFEPWDLLIAARTRFESHLPVERPQTEHDIALHLPGKYLILIEAKFTSPNTFYTEGPRRNKLSLTKNELLDLYWDHMTKTLNLEKAHAVNRVPYQLWRNLIFAEWMASKDSSSTKPFLASLTREDHEVESCREFRSLLNDEACFTHISWEGTTKHAGVQPASRLWCYLANKTASLQRAFKMNEGQESHRITLCGGR